MATRLAATCHHRWLDISVRYVCIVWYFLLPDRLHALRGTGSFILCVPAATDLGAVRARRKHTLLSRACSHHTARNCGAHAFPAPHRQYVGRAD